MSLSATAVSMNRNMCRRDLLICTKKQLVESRQSLQFINQLGHDVEEFLKEDHLHHTMCVRKFVSHGPSRFFGQFLLNGQLKSPAIFSRMPPQNRKAFNPFFYFCLASIAAVEIFSFLVAWHFCKWPDTDPKSTNLTRVNIWRNCFGALLVHLHM